MKDHEDGYSRGPFVAIRVFPGTYGWEIDAVDADGDFSEACWSVNPHGPREGQRMTREEAATAVPMFSAQNANHITNVRFADDPISPARISRLFTLAERLQ